ncbi:hypothetical protein [Acinetobacter gerneri]|uniref:hypothetical protein n=1 Tax=Acinetobacter gerneri TaxID=202952 RepID=UPI0028AE8348|nr:hypothetical protein [Acinetobacter gerneri]
MVGSVRITSTLPSSGYGSEETPKEKYIGECKWKFYYPLDSNTKVWSKAEMLEKQRCEEVINNKFSIDEVLHISVFVLTLVFFISCVLKGRRVVKKNEAITREKADMSVEMPVIFVLSFVISTFVFVLLYVAYIVFLSYKY